MKTLYPAVILITMLTLVTGLLYPSLITGIAQSVFPEKANGSLIMKNGQAVGSRLIGQNFTEPKYFWGRPSATATHTMPRRPAVPIWGRPIRNWRTT